VLLPVSLAAHIGGLLTLFAGVIGIASISVFGLRSPLRRWTTVALLAAVVIWSFTWIGVLLQTYELAQSHGIGYWTLSLSVAVVVAGALIAFKGLTPDRRENRPTM
jgi:hypothetical protein